MKNHTRSIQIALLVAGCLAFVYLGDRLRAKGALEAAPRNVMHLKGSPFGRTLALAMRGPVDIYWHRGAPHSHEDGDHSHDGEDGHVHDENCDHGDEHAHGDDDHHHHEDEGVKEQLAADIAEAADASQAPGEAGGARGWLLDNIDEMKTAYYSRTNQRADTRLHRAFIMGETQKRLRLSYEMDPTNNACYGAYFMFLSEALARVQGEAGEDGVVRHLQESALRLANETIDYCLKYRDEAPAMITSASAAHDFLQIYFNRPDADPKVAANYLRILDGSIQQYEALRSHMIADGTWENLSIHRRSEMQGAHQLMRKLREGDHKIFADLTNTAGVSPLRPGPGS